MLTSNKARVSTSAISHGCPEKTESALRVDWIGAGTDKETGELFATWASGMR